MSDYFDDMAWAVPYMRVRDLLDDDEHSEYQREFWEAWWRGIAEEFGKSKSGFAEKLISNLGEPQENWPGKPVGHRKSRHGVNQKELAEILGVSEATISGATKGKVSDKIVYFLIVISQIRGVPLPEIDISPSVRVHLSGVILAMRLVKKWAKETSRVELDEEVYRCLRAALNCKAWKLARLKGKKETEQREAIRLLQQENVEGRDANWFRLAFDDWYAAFKLVIEELDSTLNRTEIIEQ